MRSPLDGFVYAWPAVFLLALGLSAAVTGCRSSSDAVRGRTRPRDQDLRSGYGELERTEAYNQYLQRELHNNVEHSVSGTPLPEGVPPRIVGSSRSRWAGRPAAMRPTTFPATRRIQVVLEPRDADNHTIKAAGCLQVQALEISQEGLKKPLSAWQVSATDLRKTWKSGLLTTGYFVVLPWKSWPTTPKVRVVVQFVSEDRRNSSRPTRT